MTILQEPTTAPPLTKCPDWSTLPPEHDWDSWDPDTGLHSLGHAGPNFGNVFVGGAKSSDAPGVVVVDAGVNDVPGDDPQTPSALLELATDCTRAAEWLRAQQ